MHINYSPVYGWVCVCVCLCMDVMETQKSPQLQFRPLFRINNVFCPEFI